MWGNRKGWMIAGVMMVLYAGMLVLIAGAGRTTAPTSWSAQPLLQQPLALPVRPGSVVDMTQPGDAGPLYRSAISDYGNRTAVYDNFISNRSREIDPNLPGIQAILKAASLNQARLFIDTPRDAISWTSDAPALDALDRVGQAVTKLGLLEIRNNRQRGVQYLEAAFALGARLYEERLSFAQMSRGLGLMSAAATALEKNTDGADREKYTQFLGAYRDYSGKLTEIQKVFSSLPRPGQRDQNAGDVFAVARNPKADRVWRVEAILKLGRYRFNAPTAGDQRSANRVLKELVAESTDPVIKTAAEMALNLTDVEFRQLGR